MFIGILRYPFVSNYTQLLIILMHLHFTIFFFLVTTLYHFKFTILIPLTTKVRTPADLWRTDSLRHQGVLPYRGQTSYYFEEYSPPWGFASQTSIKGTSRILEMPTLGPPNSKLSNSPIACNTLQTPIFDALRTKIYPNFIVIVFCEFPRSVRQECLHSPIHELPTILVYTSRIQIRRT